MTDIIGKPEEETYQCQNCFNYVPITQMYRCPVCSQIYCQKCVNGIGKYCIVCIEAIQGDKPLEPLR